MVSQATGGGANKVKTVLITGFSSRPGYAIALKLKQKGYRVIGIYNKHPVRLEGVESIKADIRKTAEKIISEYSPDAVIHAAALGLVDYCEEHKKVCYEVNVDATKRLLIASARKAAKIFYISTDYVFDGRRGLYREDDTPAPINYYGLTKLLGEEITRSLGGTVIRTSAIFGPGPGRPNFAQVLYENLLRGESVIAATDQYLSPTYNIYIAEAITWLLKAEKDIEVIHIAGPRLSRYRYALLVTEFMNISSSLVKPTTINKIPYKAPRPRDSSLDNSKAVTLFNLPLNNIELALREYINILSTRYA